MTKITIKWLFQISNLAEDCDETDTELNFDSVRKEYDIERIAASKKTS